MFRLSELGTDGLQLAIYVDALGQLVPVVRRVLDSGIDEEVQHLELELLVLLYLGLVEVDDFIVADTQARRIEVELRFLLARYAYADLAFLGEYVLVEVEFLLVVNDGNSVLEAVVYKLGDVLHILRTLESVADDITVLVDDSAVIQRVDDVNVVWPTTVSR